MSFYENFFQLYGSIIFNMIDDIDILSLYFLYPDSQMIKNKAKYIVTSRLGVKDSCINCNNDIENELTLGKLCSMCLYKEKFKCSDCGTVSNIIDLCLDFKIKPEVHYVCIDYTDIFILSSSQYYFNQEKYNLICREKCKGNRCIHCKKIFENCQCKINIEILHDPRPGRYKHLCTKTRKSGERTQNVNGEILFI